MTGFATRERSAGVKKAGEKRERQRGWLGFLPFGIVSGRRERYAPCRLASSSREEAPARVGFGSDRCDDRTRVDGVRVPAASSLLLPGGRSRGPIVDGSGDVSLPCSPAFLGALNTGYTAGLARSTAASRALLHRHRRRQLPDVACPAAVRSTSQRLGQASCPSQHQLHQARWLVPLPWNRLLIRSSLVSVLGGGNVAALGEVALSSLPAR